MIHIIGGGLAGRAPSTWINLGCFWLFQIPLAWLLAIRLRMGPIGVFIAMTVAFSMLAIVSGVIFRRGWWKTRVV